MTNLLTSYLIQTGDCSLPGIGSFIFVQHPARHEVAEKEIHPPFPEIQFNESSSPLSRDLKRYISAKQGTEPGNAEMAIHEWCRTARKRLDAGEAIHFPSLGVLRKNEEGNISFIENQHQITEPLPAIRVVHKDVNHAVLVGDKESNASEMNAILNGETSLTRKRSYWKVAAIALFAIGLGVLLFHFFTTTASHKSGNTSPITSDAPAKSYISK